MIAFKSPANDQCFTTDAGQPSFFSALVTEELQKRATLSHETAEDVSHYDLPKDKY
jgi:hypothetical protein